MGLAGCGHKVKNGSQVQRMGDRDLDMGERRCKGALVGKSVGMRNCRREEVRGGTEGCTDDCIGAGSDMGRCIGA